MSLAGMAEMPVVIVMAQRTGPSTGLPTYTAQGDLHFVLNAGQGEFPRFVVAPGDAEDAYYWAEWALNMAWKYQIPAFILSDKIVSESQYSFDLAAAGEQKEEVSRCSGMEQGHVQPLPSLTRASLHWHFLLKRGR